LIALLEQIINIPSATGEETELGEFLCQVLAQQGFQVQKQFVDQKRFNILALTNQKPQILLSTHYDVVPPFIPCTIKENTIIGRGACDAKGTIISMMMAAEQLLADNVKNFGLLLVVGEEKNSDGAKKAAELNLGSSYVVIGKPTDNKIAVGQKGTLVFRVSAKGKRGHSAYPELGNSAIHILVQNMNNWLNLSWGPGSLFGETTLNLGTFSGGEAMNIIAGEAFVEGIFRVTTDLDSLKAKIKDRTGPEITVDILSESGPQELVALDGFEKSVVNFGSDAPYLRPLGKVVLYGPGSILDAHSDNEFIKFSDILTASHSYSKIVNMLGKEIK
jgi:acetylornithine deacetylase